MRSLEAYVKAELNVLEVDYSSHEEEFIEVVAKPNFALLGRRLGKRMKEFQGVIQGLDGAAIRSLQERGTIELQGESFSGEEIQVQQQARSGTDTVSNGEIAVDLDCELTDELCVGLRP